MLIYMKIMRIILTLFLFFVAGNTYAESKNALILVVEENESQHHSVSWGGMSDGLESAVIDLLPDNARDAINNLQSSLSTVIPQIDLFPILMEQIQFQYIELFKQSLQTVRNQFGLPGSGCIGGIFDTLGTAEFALGGNDIYKVFLDEYGEEGLSNCLRELAQPYYDQIIVLTDSDASFDNFSKNLKQLHDDGYLIDLFLDIHGCGANTTNPDINNKICCEDSNGVCQDNNLGLSFYNNDRINTQEITELLNDNNGNTYNINAVYMVGCWSSELNEAWRTIGAKASNGSLQLNYYVLLSPTVFLDAFTRGEKTLKQASEIAYQAESALLNGPVFHVDLDLRPTLNDLVPIKYKSLLPCGVNLFGQYFGLPTKIDYRNNIDFCVGSALGQTFEFEKLCPPAFSKVGVADTDRCKQDILGDLRQAANWSFDLPNYGQFINMLLSPTYGENDNSSNQIEPIDNMASSIRIHSGDDQIGLAGVCRNRGIRYCYGAVGLFCGGIPNFPNGERWGCAGNNCVINAGSLEHDECCLHNNDTGTMCGRIVGQRCTNEWNKGVHRTIHNLSWKRKVNTCTPYQDNRVGRENHFLEYCAPNNTIVASDDAGKCCSQNIRMYNSNSPFDVRLARRQNVFFDGSFQPAVCISSGRRPRLPN